MKRTILTLSAALLLLTTGITPHSSAGADRPAYRTRDDIPAAYKWRLQDMYRDVRAWESDVTSLEQRVKSFARHQGHLGDSIGSLRGAIDEYVTLSRTYEKAYIYAKLSLDVNAAHPALQARADRAEKLHTLLAEGTSFLEPELAAMPGDRLQTFLASPDLAPYRTAIEEMVRNRSHLLSKEAEELLAQSSSIAKTAENTFKMLTKDLKLPMIKDASGKEVALTRANYGAFLESSDRELRARAYRSLYDTYEKYKDTYAQTLSGEVRANNFYAKARKYGSALEASLLRNDVPPNVYDSLIRTVNAHLPLLHRYVGLKKKALGLKELHMYDMYVPLVRNGSRYIPYEEAQQMVLAGLKPLGDEYVEVLRDAFKSGWIDVFSTEDKRGGAYQWGAYDSHPYVLLNYGGTLDDVSTLAHELGHAMQSYYTNKKQPYMSAHYPIFTAEVASTMNEMILFKSLYAGAKSREEKLALLYQWLENARGTLFRQTQFAEFEKGIHERDQRGEALTAETLKNFYLELHRKYYGQTVAPDPEPALEWARIPHLYYGFYVYQYATSYAASAALADQVLNEGEPAVKRIRDNFLSAGSSKPPLEVLKGAGVDMSTPEPIERAMKLFERNLDEFEKLLAENEE